jgi:hypothetical protein
VASKPCLQFDETGGRRRRSVEVNAFVAKDLTNGFFGVGFCDLAPSDFGKFLTGPPPCFYPSALEFAIPWL